MMNPIASMLLVSCCLALLSSVSVTFASSESTLANQQQNVSEEMHLITKSLEDLLSELNAIKQEANGRLSNVKNRVSTSDQERIRQTKVSRFVLKRVAELESESLSMRDELAKIFALQKVSAKPSGLRTQSKQEESDFDSEPQNSKPLASSTTTTTTVKPQEEAAKIGFDVEALKKLGTELESELEARQKERPESFRGVHEQVIKLVDNMVQNYLGNVRRTVQRMTTLVGGRRPSAETESRPRQSPGSQIELTTQEFQSLSNSIYNQIDAVGKTLRDFENKWTVLQPRQQSPLIDRVPAGALNIWRDFWDTVRKQVRVINQQFYQLSRDMSRMITGQMPISRGPTPTDRPTLLYSAPSETESDATVNQLNQKFQEFYDKMSVTLNEEQLKMENLDKASSIDANANSLIEEQDDQLTKDELTRNPALRQQIQQEISVFGSIFDIMRAFVQRLRESATNMVRDVVRPGASNNNNNDAVTPGPSIKPQVDQLLGETINSQRNINSQSKPVLLPNSRPAPSAIH